MATRLYRDYMDCERFCFRRSLRVRLTPRTSRRLIATAMDLAVINKQWTREWLEVKLRHDARSYVKGRVLLVLVNRVVLPKLLELVVEWTGRRRSAGDEQFS